MELQVKTIASATIILFLAFGSVFAQDAVQDKELVSFFKGLYEHTPSDCPERFAVNLIPENAWHGRAFSILTGKRKVSDEEVAAARKELSDLRDQILLGRNWPLKEHERVAIPYASLKPSFDGDLDSPAWAQALSFNGEFPLETTEMKDSGIKWKIMWDEDFLYAAAALPDQSIKSIEYGKSQLGPWNADCLELFVMPSLRLKAYWEIVVNPAGNVFRGLHSNSRNGGFSPGPMEPLEGLRASVKVLKDSYVVEIAVPFHEMPNYMLGNKPEPGQTVYFTMVRTDDGRKSSLRPLLYDGHNVFGYILGSLEKGSSK